MTEVSVKITSSLDTKKWSDFVYNHPHGNIFQTPEMAEVYKRTKNYEPISLAVIDDTDNIIALLQAVVIREKGILGPLSSRSIIQGGPLFVEGEEGIKALKMLIEYYDRIIRKKAIYTEIRNMWDTSEILDTLKGMRYKYYEHSNFMININRTPKEIFSDFSRDRRRNIKKAIKCGINLKIANNLEEIESFYEILLETYRKAGLPLADKTLFLSAFNVLCGTGKARVFLAYVREEVIAGRFVLCYKNKIYDWYAGAKRRYLSYHPNEFLVWCVLKWGSEKGFHIFDFGGAGNPKREYGVREFKRRFGGTMVNFGRYRKIHAPLKFWLAERGFKIYRKIRWGK